MNAKALIEAVTDFPDDQFFRYSLRVAFISSSGGGFLGSHIVDAYFDQGDSIAQMKTKIRNEIIAFASTLGYTVTSTNVSSIMQI